MEYKVELPSEYAFCDLTEEQQKMAKEINPECESVGWRENEKLIRRDENGCIIIPTIEDKTKQMDDKIKTLEETFIYIIF